MKWTSLRMSLRTVLGWLQPAHQVGHTVAGCMVSSELNEAHYSRDQTAYTCLLTMYAGQAWPYKGTHMAMKQQDANGKPDLSGHRRCHAESWPRWGDHGGRGQKH